MHHTNWLSVYCITSLNNNTIWIDPIGKRTMEKFSLKNLIHVHLFDLHHERIFSLLY